ncbi:MFS transporter [Variovorax guangxiensis]|uniref:MFS transporter n=1 Tax=Variovorax guangxiensis TaxID=1775474 RepID=UPI00285711BD|nr:MFS transporter [Variovorax guangxiensis]MDR6858626.1 putative MFS family arabinose efflux permease [Variovorax guangxiensis]
MSSRVLDAKAVADQCFDRSAFGLLCVCAFASMASLRVCDAMLPLLAAEFSATTGEAAKVISGFALAYGVLQLFFGPLGDRYGKARVVGLATLACTVGSVSAALSQTLGWLTLSRVAMGVAAAGIIPLTMAWIGDSVSYESRQEVLAKMLGATVLGMVCGQWFGGLISEWMGWRTAFGLLAAVFLASGAALTKRVNASERSVAAFPESVLQRLKFVIASGWAKVILLITCIEGMFAFSALAFIPSHLHARFGLSMTWAGAVVALYGVGGLAYSRGARGLLRRLGEAGLAKLGAVSLLIAFMAIAFAQAWWWAIPACLLAGFGFYALHNTLQTNATQMAPQARGTAMSLFSCVLFLGQSIGVLLAAELVDGSSEETVFATAAVGLFVLGLLFALLVSRRGKRMAVI